MQEYDGSATGLCEYGYSQGYQVNVQLREGERLTRNWFHRGLHVNQSEGSAPGCLTGVPGEGDLRYAPHYGDLAPGRVGNGTLEYDVPLADGAFRGGALLAENLAARDEDGRSPALHVKQAQQPGTLLLRMPCSYVYLAGEVRFTAVVPHGGRIDLLFSDNNGLDWKPLSRVTASGPGRVDLTPQIFRRYDYRLKLVLRGRGTGLEALRLRHDIQHSQRALPALAQGPNRITVSAGPPEGTVTIEGSLDPRCRGKQLLWSDFHPRQEGLSDSQQTPGLLALSGRAPLAAAGSLTFPIATPGEMTRLRFGCHYRARGKGDGWEMQLSFDGGKNFRTVARCDGPTTGDCRYVTFTEVPRGTRSALVRWAGRQQEATCLFGLRIDADYREPRGGVAPIKVTYVWEEGGKAKKHILLANTPSVTTTLLCQERPIMKSLIVERYRAPGEERRWISMRRRGERRGAGG
jgi:hypothetical protein